MCSHHSDGCHNLGDSRRVDPDLIAAIISIARKT